MFRNALLPLLAAAALAASLPELASAAAGCCQYRSSCESTDDADACTAAQGFHYQLAFCDGTTCHPTASGDPDQTPVDPRDRDVRSAPVLKLPAPQNAAAAFDCVTKDGSFCQGELGPGNRCVSSTTCTPEQLEECLPGFPMCPEEDEEPAPAPEPFAQT